MDNFTIGVHSTPCWCTVHAKIPSHHVKVCIAHWILASVIHTPYDVTAIWCAVYTSVFRVRQTLTINKYDYNIIQKILKPVIKLLATYIHSRKFHIITDHAPFTTMVYICRIWNSCLPWILAIKEILTLT